jgi:hypothetical protein
VLWRMHARSEVVPDQTAWKTEVDVAAGCVPFQSNSGALSVSLHKNGPCSESELAADSLRCQSRTICHARRAIASARSWPHSILTRYTETFATMSSATMPVLPYQLGRNVREWNGSRTRLHGATAVVEIGRGLPPKCAAAVLEEQCLGVMARPTLTRVSAMTARPTQRCSEPAGHAGLRGPRLGARGCGATV